MATEQVQKTSFFALSEKERESSPRRRCSDFPLSEEAWKQVFEKYAAMLGIRNAFSGEMEFGEVAEKASSLWKKGERALFFSTSGSTGIPRMCRHSEEELLQEIHTLLPMISKPQRILAAIPVHHLYGFTFGVHLADALHVPACSLTPFPAAICSECTSNDLFLAVPLLIRKMAEAHKEHFVSLETISGTMPLDEESASFLKGRSPLLEIFGSSETGVIGTRTNVREPFALMPYFSRSLRKKEGLSRRLPDGREKFYPCTDHMEWADDRHFFPRGRLDTALQVGGKNVYPEKIADYLCTYPCVEKCAVRLSSKGSRLKAFIVLKDEKPTLSLRRALRDYVKKGLSPEEQPTRFDFGSSLPQNAFGKFVDWKEEDWEM